MSEVIKQHYQTLYAKHGDSPQAVQQISLEAQQVRFALMLRNVPKDASILDIGCGLSDLLAYMRHNGFTGKYIGIDIVPEFVERAASKYSSDVNAEFYCHDIVVAPLDSDFDYAFVSGMFNNKMEDNEGFLHSVTARAMADANCGMIINLLSTHVDYQDDELFYYDPGLFMAFCKQTVTPYINIYHHYVTREGAFPYEYTVEMFKQPYVCKLA